MEKNRLEEQVNDIIHCFICYGKVYKPYMCQICHKLYCQDCLKLWYKNGGKNCAMCKTNFKISDFIEIPWMDDLSTYMIEEQSKSKNTENKKNNNVNNNYEINENDNLNNELLDNDKKFCSFHSNNLINYYCIECNQYYCSECFVFWNKEKDNHLSHKIITLSDINKFNLQKCIDLYKKIKKKKISIHKKISQCEKKLFETKYEQSNKLKQIDLFNENIKNTINHNLESLNEFQDVEENFSQSIKNAIKNKDKNEYVNIIQTIISIKDTLENLNNKKHSYKKNYNTKFLNYTCDLFKIQNLKKLEILNLLDKDFNDVIPNIKINIKAIRFEENKDMLINIKFEKKNINENEYDIDNNNNNKNNDYIIYLSYFDNNERKFIEVNVEKRKDINKNILDYQSIILYKFYSKACSYDGDLEIKLLIYQYINQ